MVINRYEALVVLLIILGLTALGLGGIIAAGLLPKIQDIVLYLKALLVNPMLYAIGIAITSFVIAGLLCRLINWKYEQKNSNTNDKQPLKINKFDLTADLEDVRHELWASYNDNAKNHVSYILSIVVALFALLVGSNVFSNSLIISGIIWLIILAVFAFLGWLLLRSVYWTIWAGTIMLLSPETIVDNFNKCNSICRYYNYDDLPPCSAILHIAAKQSLIDYQAIKNMSFAFMLRKLVLKTGNLSNRKN